MHPALRFRRIFDHLFVHNQPHQSLSSQISKQCSLPTDSIIFTRYLNKRQHVHVRYPKRDWYNINACSLAINSTWKGTFGTLKKKQILNFQYLIFNKSVFFLKICLMLLTSIKLSFVHMQPDYERACWLNNRELIVIPVLMTQFFKNTACSTSEVSLDTRSFQLVLFNFMSNKMEQCWRARWVLQGTIQAVMQ